MDDNKIKVFIGRRLSVAHLCGGYDLLTPTTLHFLRVNAQMCNLTKQKTDA